MTSSIISKINDYVLGVVLISVQPSTDIRVTSQWASVGVTSAHYDVTHALTIASALLPTLWDVAE